MVIDRWVWIFGNVIAENFKTSPCLIIIKVLRQPDFNHLYSTFLHHNIKNSIRK